MKWLLVILYMSGSISVQPYEDDGICRLNADIIRDSRDSAILNAYCFRGEILESR